MARYSDSIPNTSWKNVSDPVSSEGFKGSPNIKKDTDWGSVFKGLFDTATKSDKYRSQFERNERPFGGEWNQPKSGQILDNLGAVYPQQFSPMYLPGQEGEPGTFSKIAGVAAPFANLIPGVGPVVSAGLSAASRTGW